MGARRTRPICSHHACSHGSHRRGVNRQSRRNRARSDFHRCLCHRLRVHESCSGHCRNGTRHSLIHVGGCLNVVVHHICDGGLLHHGVCNVHIRDVLRARLVRRHVHFARRQGNPRHSAAFSEISRRIRIPHKCNERRGIDGSLCGYILAGFTVRWNPNPTSTTVPVIIHVRPPAVMRRHESRRRVVHPRPAPRIHPSPVTVSVGRPISRNMRRDPDRAVSTIRPPGAISIEVFRASQFRGNVTG